MHVYFGMHCTDSLIEIKGKLRRVGELDIVAVAPRPPSYVIEHWSICEKVLISAWVSPFLVIP